MDIDSVSKQLANILSSVEAFRRELQDVRERIIKLETHGYHERLSKVEAEADSLRDRVTILETKGKFFTAGVSAGVAIIVSAVGAIVSFLLKG